MRAKKQDVFPHTYEKSCNQILQSFTPAELPRVQNLLDFIFFFVIYQIGRGAQIVGAVCYCLSVWREKIDMEHWVDAPLRGKFEAVIN